MNLKIKMNRTKKSHIFGIRMDFVRGKNILNIYIVYLLEQKFGDHRKFTRNSLLENGKDFKKI